MPIIALKKYLFVGVREDLDAFFRRAQDKGVCEFISPSGKKNLTLPESTRHILQALKILRKLPLVPVAPNASQINLAHVAEKTLAMKGQIDRWTEQKQLLTAEIARITPLGDFSLAEIARLEKESGRHIQFFCVKKGKSQEERATETLLYLGSDYDLDYFMSIHAQPQRFSGMIEMHLEKSLGLLQKELGELEHSIKQAHEQLKRMTAYMGPLRTYLTEELNRHHLSFAIGLSERYLSDSLFAVEAWVPTTQLPALFPLLEGIGVHAEEIAITEGERIPTYMENKNYGAIGEDLVHVYDTPAPEDKDPSKWVFWSFVVFFALIISDAGYGFLYLIFALVARWKLPHLKGTGKRFLRLVTAIATSCIIWGVFSGAYFGIDLPPNHPMNRVSIVHYLARKKADYHVLRKDADYEEWVKRIPALSSATTGEEFLNKGFVIEQGRRLYKVSDDFNDSIFLELALMIGIIHIALSLLRFGRRHAAGIGWVIAIVGGYLYFPQTLQSSSLCHFTGLIAEKTAFTVGWQLLMSGIVIAIGLALIQNRWRGLIEISKPIELFADILSYLRLYALGLAGITLAATFNGIGRDVGGVFGVIIVVAGHLTNITVGIMGGVIHGLRLNFIEWYHHSFAGGGKLFQPLKLLK